MSDPTNNTEGIVIGIRYRLYPASSWRYLTEEYYRMVVDCWSESYCEIEPFIMSRAEFDALPEFEGW